MSLPHEIAMALRTTYWTLHRQSDACLAPLGMTANQFVILSLLSDRDRVTQCDLVERAASDANSLRALLIALEAKGLVERRRHPDDGRARCVTLTPKGRRTYEALWKQSEALRQQLQSVLRPDEAKLLLSLLARIENALEPAGSSAMNGAARSRFTATAKPSRNPSARREPTRKTLHSLKG